MDWKGLVMKTLPVRMLHMEAESALDPYDPGEETARRSSVLLLARRTSAPDAD